jgi:hypothetical protein
MCLKHHILQKKKLYLPLMVRNGQNGSSTDVGQEKKFIIDVGFPDFKKKINVHRGFICNIL